MSITFVFVIFLSLIASGITGIQTPDRSLREVKERFEADVLDLRFEAQRVYASYKCDPAKLLQSCQQSNYDACRSSFPNPRCDSEHKHGDNVCGRFENGTTAADKNNASCHGMVADPTVTSIYVPSFSPTNFYDNGTTMDPLLVEDICISHRLEEYFVEKAADSASSPRSMFFAGAATGLLRIYPARTLPFCDDSSSAWDPRQEPWYQLATRAPASGKTVVILLDTSRSMNQRLEHLRGPVRHVIDTLNDGVDRLAIVPFSTAAYEITVEEAVLVPITRTTKRHLLQLVDQLLTMEAGGSTNMMAAFEKTFEILEYGMVHNMAEESCFTVILFFTDGSMTDPPGKTEQDVIDFINHGLSRAENMLQQPVFTLIYSVVDGVTGDDDDRTVSFPKTLACSSARASWASLNTHTRVHESLAGYDALVEWGLQPRSSSNFTAWAEPYLFAASAAAVGISITAPVFGPDNQLIGVVGIEVSLDDLRAASKEEGNMTLRCFSRLSRHRYSPTMPFYAGQLGSLCTYVSITRGSRNFLWLQ
ncbi:Calcium channel, voltage-dependent, alpha 2 delta subunit [Seminavis robusta]|uniref:Calcium channel, voltage-dependent, alpha 2 delta subunit n=1 Tax=Seminavis robusta TaxID=568900 RepID=A0A9N8ER13_9STRA|nr:Calcium channel, voltage-dependent, alpha 2 delta subunit [Seminavis robusta]|eukprot:Sro1713_g292980.1 Calcium channel, voltage-dependent, alpha 2 delta subunit (534) ;mRNA; r:15537-17138